MTLSLLVACDSVRLGGDTAGGTGWTVDSDTPATWPESWWGETPGGGLGASLTASGGRAWAGAPWGDLGAVWALGAALAPSLDGHALPTLGFSLARSDAGVLAAGAPLAVSGIGALVRSDSTAVALEGPVLGGRIAWSGESLWAVGGDRIWRGGSAENLPARAGGLAVRDGAAVVGLPRGDTALWVDGERWDRPQDSDEAGFAVCVADLDGDGRDDLAVGAPGSSRVHLVLGDADSLTDVVIQGPEGRFGHALACAEQTLVVGAPLAQGGRGAVWLLDDPLAQLDAGEPVLVGQSDSDQLGAAVAVDSGQIWAGAPGADAGAGRVDRLSR